jgi:hypothetical protein
MAKRKKSSQIDLPAMEGPGVAAPRISAIDRLADEYTEIRDQRMALTPQEVVAKRNLIAALHKHADKLGVQPDGAIVYRYDTVQITLIPGKEKLKVQDIEDMADAEEEP